MRLGDCLQLAVVLLGRVNSSELAEVKDDDGAVAVCR